MSQVTYYTEEGLKKIKDELHQLKSVERPKFGRASDGKEWCGTYWLRWAAA